MTQPRSFLGTMLGALAPGLLQACLLAPPRSVASSTPTPAPSATASPSPTESPTPSPSPSASPTPKPEPVASPTRGEVVTHGDRNRKVVALTFDDGPNHLFTRKALAILKENDVHATFFLVGTMIQPHPDIVREIKAAGHEIGNHTLSHADLVKLGPEGRAKEIRRCQELLVKATGDTPKYMRPPYGSFNAAIVGLVREMNLRFIYWDVDPEDWRKSKSPETIRDFIVREAKPGSVVLMHDANARTIEALPGVIAGLREKGLGFVTISDLINPPTANP